MDIVKVFGSNMKKYRTAIGISLENIQRIADALGIETYILFWED